MRLLYSAADGFFIALKQRTVGGVIRSNGLPAKYHHKHAAGAIPGRSFLCTCCRPRDRWQKIRWWGSKESMVGEFKQRT